MVINKSQRKRKEKMIFSKTKRMFILFPLLLVAAASVGCNDLGNIQIRPYGETSSSPGTCPICQGAGKGSMYAYIYWYMSYMRWNRKNKMNGMYSAQAKARPIQHGAAHKVEPLRSKPMLQARSIDSINAPKRRFNPKPTNKGGHEWLSEIY